VFIKEAEGLDFPSMAAVLTKKGLAKRANPNFK
jgi:hypothetical protein